LLTDLSTTTDTTGLLCYSNLIKLPSSSVRDTRHHSLHC